MLKPQGQIIAIGAAADRALVAIAPEVVCKRCAAGKGCGAGLLGGRRGPAQITASVANGLDLAVGDEVAISLQPQHVLRAAVLVYGVPLAAANAATALAYLAGLGDGATACAALAGLFAGLGAARLRLRQSQCLQDFTPAIVERLARP